VPTLLNPDIAWREAFVALAQDWFASGVDRYGLARTDFRAYLQRLLRQREGVPAEGWVPSEEFWLADGGAIVAVARLRTRLTPALESKGGHIGYDVRPSARRRGYGRLVLRLALERAWERGLRRALLTADADNAASRRIIEHNGGRQVDEGHRAQDGRCIVRYWIDAAEPSLPHSGMP
jgi:predicted acetyltransferase